MIDLKEHKEDLNILLKGMNVFILGNRVLSFRKSQRWEGIVSSLILYYGRKWEKEIRLLCTLCAAALRHNMNGSSISLDHNSYIAANKLTKQGVSYFKMKALLEQLDKEKFIELYVGYYDFDGGVNSFFVMLPSFLDMWEGIDVSKAPTIEYDTIIVRDSNTKEQLDTRCFRGIVSLRKDLDKYNALLKTATIRINKQLVEVLNYKRVFHDNLNTSGRWYSNNSFQTIAKEQRKNITINGKATVELDYSAIHPRILYCLEKKVVDKEFSPYTVGGECRNKTKFCLLSMLYNKDRLSAKRTITSHLKIEWERVEEIMCAIENNNKDILHHFYHKGMWGMLQNKDSSIAAEVITMCVERNIICLPYHDSFRVVEGHEEILKGIMFEAWNKVLGTTNNCVVVCK